MRVLISNSDGGGIDCQPARVSEMLMMWGAPYDLRRRLQRELLAGEDTTEVERLLGVEVELA